MASFRSVEYLMRELNFYGVELFIIEQEEKRKLAYRIPKNTVLSDRLKDDIQKHAPDLLVALHKSPSLQGIKKEVLQSKKQKQERRLPQETEKPKKEALVFGIFPYIRIDTSFSRRDKTIIRIQKELSELSQNQKHVYDDVVGCKLPIKFKDNKPFVETTRLRKTKEYPTGINIPITISPLA